MTHNPPMTSNVFVRTSQAIDGLDVVGEPVMSGFAFQSTDPSLNILAVADAMETKGCVGGSGLLVLV